MTFTVSSRHIGEHGTKSQYIRQSGCLQALFIVDDIFVTYTTTSYKCCNKYLTLRNIHGWYGTLQIIYDSVKK